MATNQYGALAQPAAAPSSGPPTLGYGNTNSASIDSVNQWMRGQPWYQALIRSFGQDPNNVHLNDSQKQAIIKAAQANGVIVDEGGGGQDVDDSGNFEAKSHTGRNIAIVAAIAGAIAAPYLIPAIAGAVGGGGAAAAGVGAAEAAGEGGVLASTALPVTGALATGAASSLGAGGATAIGSAAAGGAFDAAGNFIGPSTVAGEAGTAGAGAAAAAGAGGAAKAASSWLAPVLGAGIGAAGNIIGAGIQSSANEDAAKIQAQSIQNALDFAKQEYATKVGALQPYTANGMASNDRMAQLLNLPARAGTTATGTPLGGPTRGADGQPVPQAAAPAQDVLMQAPDGSPPRMVPAEAVAAAQQKGATIVQQQAAPAGNQYARLAA